MSAAWLTRDANVAGLRKLLDGNGIPLWQPSLQVGVPDRLLGYPVVDDPNVAAFATGATATASSVKGLAFGDFSAFYIRDVQGIRFERSDEFAFSTDLVTFRAILRTDSDLIDTSAIKLLIGGTA
jgi:HK97 family phage major capsid protein